MADDSGGGARCCCGARERRRARLRALLEALGRAESESARKQERRAARLAARLLRRAWMAAFLPPASSIAQRVCVRGGRARRRLRGGLWSDSCVLPSLPSRRAAPAGGPKRGWVDEHAARLPRRAHG